VSFDQASGTFGQGMYGRHGPLEVTVQAVRGIAGFAVHMAYDFPVRRSEALAAFAERIAAKDEPGNDVVVVTCGVPDENGWASATDHALFLHLLTTYRSGAYILPKKPTHIRGLLIHQSPDSPGLLLLANDDDDLPWRVSPGSGAHAGPPPSPRFRRPAT
jgi:hypothetical protein